MKKTIQYSAIILALGLLSSCGTSAAYINSQTSTQVHLSNNNYEVISRVSGSSEVAYVLIFGGMNKKRLYENAYAEMVKKAELTGSRALVNIVTEEHIGGVPPFYYERTITVSAHVVEFTK
ncbi:hypothetical protein BFP97_05560 [Roseivirga sp. 4D4]|uniref:DUF6567 family protein n=1 Tax=Roseivirga sp. 4D4 TaxID=1889784 RepID=UPI0008535DE7|nr:DUF6567 family protein [Roseivirga sp. 4D4]OEK03761.1 hypothetical protein BFP97_05560 [Roseivirga sp. 4D4]